MKRLILIVLMPCFCTAQEPDKGSNTIVVKPVAFQQVISVLLDAGYTFASKDTVDKVALTEFKSEQKTKMNYRIRARVKDSCLYLSGQFKLGLEIHSGLLSSDPNELSEIQYSGWRTGAYRIMFAKIKQVADSLHSPVTYVKL